MIRYIYDLNYAEEQPSTLQERLIFCMNVFIVADKYDVASLRQRVAPAFSDYLQSAWQSDEFGECVEKLCGPDAINLADPALQVIVANFFTNNMSRLTYHKGVFEMIKKDKSFTGRVLAGLLEAPPKTRLR
jgi:hypothetical protein